MYIICNAFVQFELRPPCLHRQHVQFLLHHQHVLLARSVSSAYVNFSDLGIHSIRNQRPHSYIRLSRRTWTIVTLSWRVRRKRRSTTLQLVWSAVPTSSTEACRDSSIPSYIRWMFLSKSCTSSESWCSTTCMVKRLRTSRSCANHSHVSHRGNISNPPPNSS